jgi:CheY-like chemotaxis protein
VANDDKNRHREDQVHADRDQQRETRSHIEELTGFTHCRKPNLSPVDAPQWTAIRLSIRFSRPLTVRRVFGERDSSCDFTCCALWYGLQIDCQVAVHSMARILIVDDDDSGRFMLTEALLDAGFEVLEAQNGKEALEVQALQNADLLITDLLMPEKEGLETIREFRKKYPGLPIIAMSGGGFIEADGYLEMAKRVGASSVLKKPFTATDLLLAVHAFLPIRNSE